MGYLRGHCTPRAGGDDLARHRHGDHRFSDGLQWYGGSLLSDPSTRLTGVLLILAAVVLLVVALIAAGVSFIVWLYRARAGLAGRRLGGSSDEPVAMSGGMIGMTALSLVLLALAGFFAIRLIREVTAGQERIMAAAAVPVGPPVGWQ